MRAGVSAVSLSGGRLRGNPERSGGLRRQRRAAGYLRRPLTNGKHPQPCAGKLWGWRRLGKPMPQATNGADERVPGPEGGEFSGFAPPRQNWTPLPNELIRQLPRFTSHGELAVVLYAIRHTWGWHRASRRITLDEFEHGIKRRDGSRLDDGVGLSRPTIIKGLKRAVDHGFLDVTEEGPDAGRMSHRYAVRIGGVPADDCE